MLSQRNPFLRIIAPALLCLVVAACHPPASRHVLQPDDSMLAMCVEGSRQTSSNPQGTDITCDLSPISVEYVLKNPQPGETLAKIKCQAHDEDGEMVVSTCTCQGDSISTCESFAQRCRDKGYEELGGGPEFSICHVNPQD